MVRYLLLKVVLPGAVLNFVINWLAGQGLLPAGPTLPLWGTPGMAIDTLVGGFLIAFFSMLLVIPGGRREARSGRVRGLGRQASWLRAPARRPVLVAVGGGVVFALLLAAPAVWYWSARGVEQMDRDGYIWIKAFMSAGIGVTVSVVAALIGLAPEPDVSGDPRWLRADGAGAPQGPSYPCQYLDKAGLAATDRAHGCSATPTWHLQVRGVLDPAHVRVALADLLVRYPSLATRVRALDGVPPHATRFRYVHDPAVSADALFAHHDLRGQAPAVFEALCREHHSRFLDPFTEPPLTLTLAVTADDACHLLFRQHHAIADGRAFIALLGDFATYLEAARAGRRPVAATLVPIGRRDELEALGLSAPRRLAYTLAGIGRLFAGRLVGVARPLRALRQNLGNDYTGADGTVHRVFGADALARWKADGKAHGVSLNSWLTAALFAANQRWHHAADLPVGRTSGILMMETRPRDAGFVSFANHLAALEVTVDLRGAPAQPALARAIQAQVEQQRRRDVPLKRYLMERFFVRVLPLDELHKVVFASKRPSHSLDFSNLIALDFPALGGDGWSVDEVFITTPVIPRAGIVLTVIRYRDQVCFNFNYTASAVARDEVERLAAQFAAVLAAPASVPAAAAAA